MQFTRAYAKKHAKVALLGGSLFFKSANVSDVLEFGIGRALILTLFSSKPAKNETCLFFSAYLYEPTGRLRHEPDNTQQAYEGHNLESYWKPPNKGRRPIAVEGSSTVSIITIGRNSLLQ